MTEPNKPPTDSPDGTAGHRKGDRWLYYPDEGWELPHDEHIANCQVLNIARHAPREAFRRGNRIT